jgi:hypothetical protein
MLSSGLVLPTPPNSPRVPHRLALLVFEGSCRTGMSNHKQSTRLAHERAATHYGVPFLAYADLMPVGKCTGERLARHVAACRPHALPRHQSTYTRRRLGLLACTMLRWMGKSSSHPGYKTHELLANTLAVWWSATVDALPAKYDHVLESRAVEVAPPELRAPLTDQVHHFSICKVNAAVYDANAMHGRADSRGVRIAKGNWTLYEERPGKFGWISVGLVGARIGFDMSFGELPRASVVFEQGYEGFGDAVVTVGWRAFPRQLLRGRRADAEKVTQAQVLTITGTPETHNPKGVGMMLRARSWETLWVTTTTIEKFKLRYVSSC